VQKVFALNGKDASVNFSSNWPPFLFESAGFYLQGKIAFLGTCKKLFLQSMEKMPLGSFLVDSAGFHL
jgi:hypothetical protein